MSVRAGAGLALEGPTDALEGGGGPGSIGWSLWGGCGSGACGGESGCRVCSVWAWGSRDERWSPIVLTSSLFVFVECVESGWCPEGPWAAWGSSVGVGRGRGVEWWGSSGVKGRKRRPLGACRWWRRAHHTFYLT